MLASVSSPNWVTGSAASAALYENVSLVFETASGVLPACATKPTRILGEHMKRLGCLVTVLICLLAALPAVYGQSVTGQISGVVVDPAGAVVPGADVQLIHDLSQTIRHFATEASGSFFFTGLVPGTYSLKIARTGFKGYDSKGITVATQERADLHEVHLQVSDVSSTIEIQANALHGATDSSGCA